jgi:hypothetical protein
VLIEKGLKGGERVVVDGQARIAPGATVEVRPAPAAQAPAVAARPEVAP